MRHHRFVPPAIAVWLGIACASDGPDNTSIAITSITTAAPPDTSAGGEGLTDTTDADSGSDGGTGTTTGGPPTTGPAPATGDADPSTGDAPDGGVPGTTGPDPGPAGSTSTGDASTGDASTAGDDQLPPPPPGPPGTPTDPGLLVAVMGDQGNGSDTKAVYELILAEGAEALIILGDFDYEDNPGLWAKEMDAALGTEFPVFGLVGNHDKSEWKGYQARLQARLAKIPGAECTGDLGVKSSCKYRGLHFILSGIGTIGSDSEHEEFIADSLAADDSLWSLCAWHKNMRDLQAGDKSDDITWKAVQNCQDGGAIVLMGHEHSYARTLTLTAVGDKGSGHGAVGVPELMEIGEGSTFSVCSGLGGKSIREYDSKLHDDDTWWASIYTKNHYRKNGVEVDDFDADHGVLFMRFGIEGNPALAHGYFKNIQGELIDEFDMVRK